jgi:arylsulfatase
MHKTSAPKRMYRSAVSGFLFAGVLLGMTACVQQVEPEAVAPKSTVSQRPNVLLILADDLGYSDIQPFGGEIQTPNLDQLAQSGLVLSNFHAHALCTPTRAMLLTGINNHAAGIGTMAAEQRGEQKGAPGYEAYLRAEVPTIADLLQANGYRTYISGKWDLGGRKDPQFQPQNRGFDESFVLVEGSADHFRNYPALAELPSVTFRHNGEPVSLPSDFYSSVNYTDQMLSFLEQHQQRDDEQPFFAYLSYTAPHYPLQAPDEDIARYSGVYEQGYESIRRQRLQEMKRRGIVANNIEAAPGHPAWPAWSELSDTQKAFEVRRMEVYAAMVEVMDRQIGRVLEALRRSGELDNTLIVFMSDNGAEGGNPLDWADYYTQWATENFDLSLENLGRSNSFAWTGPGWAQVSSTPMGLYKGFMSEGGIRVPAILHWPAGIQRQGVSDSYTHVLDLPATILDLAKTKHPGTRDRGFGQRRLEGRSMKDFLSARNDTVHPSDDVSVWEMLDRRAVRQGDWKLVWANQPWGKGLGQWALYHLAEDPTELNDVSEQYPQKVAQLLLHWKDYVERNQLVLVDEGIDILWSNIRTHYNWSPVPSEAQQREAFGADANVVIASQNQQ